MPETPVEVDLIACRGCGELKDPETDFYWKKYKSGSYWRDPVCKLCRKPANAASGRAWRERPGYNDWFARYQRERYAADLETSRAFSRNRMQIRMRGASKETIEWEDAVLRYDPCTYCGSYTSDTMQIDHIVPVDLLGEPNTDNIVAACRPCNSSKGRKPLLEYLLCRL